MEIFVSMLICFLAVYGVFQLLYNIACRITKSKNLNLEIIHRIIPINDSSTDIESYVRYLALRNEGERVILLNRAGSPEILKTIELLEVEFEFLRVMTYEEYLDFIEKDTM